MGSWWDTSSSKFIIHSIAFLIVFSLLKSRFEIVGRLHLRELCGSVCYIPI